MTIALIFTGLALISAMWAIFGGRGRPGRPVAPPMGGIRAGEGSDVNVERNYFGPRTGVDVGKSSKGKFSRNLFIGEESWWTGFWRWWRSR